MGALLVVGLGLVVAALAIVVWLLRSGAYGWLIALGAVAAVCAGVAAPARNEWRERCALEPSDDRSERVATLVERLCLVADLPPPLARVIVDSVPLSWATALPGRKAQLCITTGMLERVSDDGLETVIGHELSHIANRDAVLMTVFATPSALVLRGLERLLDPPEDIRFGPLLRASPGSPAGAALCVAVVVAPWALTASVVARTLSRYRELAADRGAAVLTGAPSALAAVLIRLSGDARNVPTEDLRIVASRDVFHLVGTTPDDFVDVDVRWMWATHPSMSERLAQLDRLESTLQR